jgi:hypothetical protein
LTENPAIVERFTSAMNSQSSEIGIHEAGRVAVHAVRAGIF